MNKKWISLFIITINIFVIAGAIARPVTPQKKISDLSNLYVWCEMGDVELGFINTRTDQIVQVPLQDLDGWPGSTCQHVWVSPDGKTVYASVDATPSAPAAVIIADVRQIDWNQGQADLEIIKTLILDPPGSLSSYPYVEQVVPGQPIADWVIRSWTQAHGPTFLPHSPYTYITQWTDRRIRVIDTRTHELAPIDPINFGEVSRQTHGVSFNHSGTLGLGTGYFYDHDEIDVYRVNKHTGDLRYLKSIRLGDEFAHAAFTHYTVWLNNRYALTASMQFGPTSLTPLGSTIIGPGVWLLDVVHGTAKQIIGTAASADDAGVFRSPSDLAVANFQLYVAEEDSLDGTFGDDGYISVFDISNIPQPRFIKRFRPGIELPADFYVAHGINATPDGRSVYVASYASNYIIKIDTLTNEVVKVYGPEDGLNMPHGGYIAGNSR